jgi:excisionase family DNA binding protein
MTPVTTANARVSAVSARRDELLTVKEYAHVMRLHVKSVYRLISGNRIPGVVRVTPREIRIDMALVDWRLDQM